MMRFRRSFVEVLESRQLLSGDPVLAWNSVAIQTLVAEQEFTGPGFASRGLAMLHAAIFDAMDAIEGGFQPLIYDAAAPPDASVDAAVAAAAQAVLSSVFPGSATAIATAYSNALADVPDGAQEDEGVAVGLAAADAILSWRTDDGSSALTPYEYGTEPGAYQATPPDYPAPWGPGWGLLDTFGVSSIDPYLPPPPPALDSQEYADAVNQVKSLGAADSTTRTADQTQIARFWSYDSQTYGSPLALYNAMLQTIAQQQENTPFENARLFALTNLAMADAGVVVWATKYRDDLWRPITAIQQADSDGNPLTQADPNWVPLGYPANGLDNLTPPFPSYPSGHSAFGAAMFSTLATFYGTDSVSFDLTSLELPGVVRHFDSFSQAAEENGMSRIYLGVHFSFDNTASLQIGRAIAADESATLLQPVGDGGHDHHGSFHHHHHDGVFSNDFIHQSP